MKVAAQAPESFRFGAFEFDPRAGELCKQGLKLKVYGQPLDILEMLLARPGEMVTREELQNKLWPGDTFVDFEHSLNAAINRLRAALDDSSETPRFVETLPRRGYRFIALLDSVPLVQTEVATVGWRRRRVGWIAGGLALAAVTLVALNVAGLRDRLLGRPVAGEITSIAVLPLKNLSGHPEQEYFADGMSGALITELGKISALRVISLQSMLRYKGTKKSMPEIARELKVDAIVEGAVLRSGNQVRIDAQLIQAEPERHLWSESFQRDAPDVLRLQSEVAVAIAREIQIVVTPDQRARLTQTRPVNPAAYTAWLRGRELYRRWDETYFDSAAEYLQKAIEVDPTFAPPYATLALMYATDIRYSWEERHLLAETTAAKALELDDGLAEAHAAQGLVKLRFGWGWAEAEREFKRALELNPNSGEAHTYYGYYLTLMGRFEEGFAALRQAIDLDPLNTLPTERLAWAYMKAGRFDDAIVLLLELKRLQPDHYMARYQLAHAYAYKGMYREALAEAERFKCTYLECGWLLAVSGRRQEARKLISRLIELSQKTYVDPGLIALTYAGLGEKDEAIKWLEQSYRLRGRWMIYMKSVREFDPLRSDARFQELMRRLNFPN